MNLSPLWVPFLVQHGYEAIHWSSVGLISAGDPEIMRYAANHNFVVFTHDLDFGMRLATTRSHAPSVVQLRYQDVLPSAIGETVVTALKAAHEHLLSGVLLTIDP